MLHSADDYQSLRRNFTWQIPARYNIATYCCDRWAETDPTRPAILWKDDHDRIAALSFADMQKQANRLANALQALGIQRSDRVAIILPQGWQVPVIHMALYKLGAIALPLAVLFGVEALEYRLRDAGVTLAISNLVGLAKIAEIRARLPALSTLLSTEGPAAGALEFTALLAGARDRFVTADTGPDDPAMMIYTSGTTGPPKGALHAHRVVLGHLPGVQMAHAFLPEEGDRLWTPADWAWAGGLLNILLPALHFGLPVVAGRNEKFDPDRAYGLMADFAVRNAFIPPTALKMLRTAPLPAGRHKLVLRTIGSGGESLGAETFAWSREAFGFAVNEFYGQTECNLVLASCARIGVSKAGFIGKPVPGHEVAVIRDDGTICAAMEPGQIAVRRPDPVMFLAYWNQPEATTRKFIGDWMTTGDQGLVDEEGYVHFIGRDDDVITSAGYRIGPGEIEDCLLKHPAVALAAVIGKPDALRTEIVKAFIQLKAGHSESETLRNDISAFVRERLSAHEYPREIAFVDSLPMTTTGKIIRRLLRDQL
ncbi:AMP-binding protein [Candidatus Raskinella chloraquaticus]|uniref:AMP-dependent synthetase n=1 Tax=Candidatus Raskinella chloraquaticus TaxID=1951219 RepID=A0A1W9HZ67_9HYPH|nr:MAG: AMP-dependent synthetase [Proteobacteria bacterium SG_bin8]